MNTTVNVENLAIDASNNAVNGCSPILAGIHYSNSSGKIKNSAISGAQLQNVSSCASFFSNSYRILVDTDGTQPGPFHVSVEKNSIHDFTKDGIHAIGSGVTVYIDGIFFTDAAPTEISTLSLHDALPI